MALHTVKGHTKNLHKLNLVAEFSYYVILHANRKSKNCRIGSIAGNRSDFRIIHPSAEVDTLSSLELQSSCSVDFHKVTLLVRK